MIEFGRVADAYGVRGWVKVVVDEPEVLADQPVWWLAGAEYPVRETKIHSGTLLAKLEGIESPEQAKALKGKAVSIPRPEAGAGRYYWSDLIGLEVVNEQGVVLGVVTRMSSNGAHDVMEVAGTKEDARTRLLPFVPAYVRQVDLQTKRIDVEWGADW
ncbi:MAG TPA: ribosome maturation factor RimM [Burkholderiales bacterium]|nr:ribosome maturation factor RimM [Burkholderiales bacterium]